MTVPTLPIAAPTERRIADRHPIEAVITATSQSNFWCGFSEDLSCGGVFVATPAAPPIGELVHLSIRVGAEPQVTAIGEVRWHRYDAEGFVCGCGVKFAMLDPRAADLLQGLLAHAAQAPLLVE
jgi:Tfp pilus assembly protein PilZ